MNIYDRITFDPGSQELHIAWPAGKAPRPYDVPSDAIIGDADVLVITWTAAEARALADVLTPGHEMTSWNHYDTDWDSYVNQLTSRSPARPEHRLGSWWETGINGKRVTCFKSELHPATDGKSLPAAQLVKQLAAEIKPELIITTGTAGGAGAGTHLGDVNVAAHVKADFTTKLAKQAYSNESWSCFPLNAAQRNNLHMLASLAPTGKIPDVPREPTVWEGDTISTDFFAFDTADDHFGLRKYDPAIRAVEMDDAAVGFGAGKTPFMSVRNASDPVMPDDSEANKNKAAEIYRRYGYWTTVNSAICTWAVIAGME